MRAPLTPLKAFLSDSERLGDTEPIDVADTRLSRWLSVAQAAVRIAALSPNDRPEYVSSLCSGLLPPTDNRPTQIDGDGSKPLDELAKLGERFRVEAEEMERAGCFELALVTVSSICRTLSTGAVSQRLLASVHMGRVMRGMGDLDNATECYTSVTDDAIKYGEGPIAAHGYIGLGNVASELGNKPLQKAHYLDALRLSPPGSPVELSSRMGLMIVARAQNDLADALLHGWRAHDLSPPNSDVQFSIINNMARVAHQAGFLDAAKAGFEFAIQQSTVPRSRITFIASSLPTLVQLGLRSEITRLVDAGSTEITKGAPPFEVSMFLLSAAETWHALGEYLQSETYANRAEELADRLRFNEVRMKVDALRRLPRSNATSRSEWQRTSSQPPVFSDDTIRIGLHRLEALGV